MFQHHLAEVVGDDVALSHQAVPGHPFPQFSISSCALAKKIKIDPNWANEAYGEASSQKTVRCRRTDSCSLSRRRVPVLTGARLPAAASWRPLFLPGGGEGDCHDSISSLLEEGMLPGAVAPRALERTQKQQALPGSHPSPWEIPPFRGGSVETSKAPMIKTFLSRHIGNFGAEQ